VTLHRLVAVVVLAMLEGGVVALPRPDALGQLGRLRSPLWAILLPGSIIVGTFGVIAWPSMAPALVILAAAATPLLTAIAMVAVTRGPRALLLVTASALAVLAVAAAGWTAQLSATLLTGLGCMTLGVALARLVPGRWVLAGAICMCILDVGLLTQGVGHASTVLMNHATAHAHGPTFDRARFGPVATDYPDLVLAGFLGGSLANDRIQRRAALLLTALATAYGMLLPIAHTLPATVPIAAVFILCRPELGTVHQRASRRLRHAAVSALALLGQRSRAAITEQSQQLAPTSAPCCNHEA
jgi:hypothetical protein